MLAISLFGVSLAEWGFLAVAGIFALDVLGFSRSARTVRQENHDLVGRNKTLEQENHHLEREVAALRSEVAALKAQVEELQKRDQEAVLRQLEKHEERAQKRHDAELIVLQELARSVRERS